jgi:hypothetical protein
MLRVGIGAVNLGSLRAASGMHPGWRPRASPATLAGDRQLEIGAAGDEAAGDQRQLELPQLEVAGDHGIFPDVGGSWR